MGFPRLAEGVSALAGQTGCPTLRSVCDLVSYGSGTSSSSEVDAPG